MAADPELKIERLPLAGTLTDRVCGALIALEGGDHGFFGDLDQWEGWKAERRKHSKHRPEKPAEVEISSPS